MLGEVDLYRGGWSFLNKLIPPPGNKNGWKRGLDGVILGGESGNKGRRVEPLWVMKIRDQCADAGVPFMFKQWNHESRNEVDENTGFPWLGSRTHSELAW
jgi:protein gp37